MVFVRWRGRCAQLLVTECTRQRCLANLRGGYVWTYVNKMDTRN